MAKDNSKDSYEMDEILSPNFFSVDFYQKRKKGKYRLTLAPSTEFPVADTHCHIEMFDNPEWCFIRAALHNVSYLACVIDSTDDGQEGFDIVEASYEKASKMLPKIIDKIQNESKPINDIVTIKAGEDVELCLDKNSIYLDAKMPELRYIVGTHPHHAKHLDTNQENNLKKYLKNPRACCVGEIGLDYHYDLSPREDQIAVFKRQLEIAEELGFPVSLHLREAHSDALKVFEEIGFCSKGTLLHCFNLGPEELKPWVEAGCFIALGGPLTFKGSDNTRKAVSLIPEDKLLTETDAPFMTPEPLRGDTCFPDHVIWTADMLAKIKNVSNRQDFYSQLMSNAKMLLGSQNDR